MPAAQTISDLLDPKNDYVFFRVFSEEPELLVDLINAVRVDEPPIVAVTLLDARLSPERLSGKRLILDLKAVDEQGRRYNVEMQVRSFGVWSARGILYLARVISEQLEAGEEYHKLKPVIGIHLLDFNLFKEPEHEDQALWCFELRDAKRPEVRLGRELQLNIVELRKADKLQQLPERLSAWIAYFEHWREEVTMSKLTHPPVQQAYAKLQTLSADEQARYWAESRAKALSDEATLLFEAREEGEKEGRRQSAMAMLRRTQLDDATVAELTGLSLADVQGLRMGSIEGIKG
ncbi:PD-(D/E)XK nuclease family transposase [Thiorhodovibrio winogradskyi]|uniref:PD-(D/E)XK nuclease family transposase n=1 Tax=Thiorhodovibrio winogradskyi TaxID=77007 RepID=A0ABZ0SE52_9GAMM|nr:Rpn family recombination-promoting nuclease/putative transposase [Thiorhodovibrio winogradskyi]